MKQTQNYQLNQWEKTDRIEMEDFNSDNSKIDAALAAEKQAREAADAAQATALRSELAAEQTAREALAGQEAADVAALRNENCWVKLKEVTTGAVNSVSINTADIDWSQYRKVEIELSMQTNQGQTLEMQINNRSDSIYHQSGYSGNRSYLTVCRGTGKAYSQITLVPIKPSNVLYGSDQYHSGSITRESFYVQDFTLNQLTSIQFFLDSNDTFVAGSEIAIYGLKK